MAIEPAPLPPRRSAGVLLHVTSLPGPFGIGDLGPDAYAWIDTLARARQTWWQVLPLGPTGYGDSPYQCFSAFAGNHYLISPEFLVHDGLLEPGDLDAIDLPASTVDYGPVIALKNKLTLQALERFVAGAAPALNDAFAEFSSREHAWLDDYALFMALKDAHQGMSWQQWPEEYLLRQPGAVEKARLLFSRDVLLHKFRQFLFFRQWAGLKAYARRQGIRLIGDMPIFVASDSADVWTYPELFRLDHRRRPLVVAGVPPDYFSRTGQLWGNPVYAWDVHRQTGFAWWTRRLRAALDMVDLVRLDHFRGFEAAWEVPAECLTAETGHWIKGPGAELFRAAQQQIGSLALIAEDLGVITPDVDALRLAFGWPGMRVMQFAFGGAPEERFLPHNHERNTVVYTGTHDNDTALGWCEGLTSEELRFLRRYCPPTGDDVAWDLIRLAWGSVADYALTPLQDILSLGTEARMNYPGRPAGNWRWRFTADQLRSAHLEKLQELTETYQRA